MPAAPKPRRPPTGHPDRSRPHPRSLKKGPIRDFSLFATGRPIHPGGRPFFLGAVLVTLEAMNVAVLCLSGLGGSSVAAATLAAHLAERGHRLWVLAPERPFRLPASDNPGYVPVPQAAYHIFAEPLTHLAIAGTLQRLLSENPVDVVHVHYALPAAPMALLALEMVAERSGTGPALVTTLHGSDVTILGRQPALQPVLLHALGRSQAVTAVSRFLRREVGALGHGGPVAVLPNVVDTVQFRPRSDPSLRSLFARPEEAVLVHVSNFRPVKAVLDVVRVFALVRRSLPARLLLVGEGPDLQRAREEVEALGATGEVAFLGFRPNVAAILAVGDVFLFPSLSESFGLAAAEAMACGVPVVGSAVGGIPEVVAHGETGFLCPPHDVEAMADATVRLLIDDGLRRRMGELAHRRVVERFSPGVVVPRYEGIYRSVAELRQGRRAPAKEPEPWT